MKILVIGLGYVGSSLAVMLSQKHEVIAADIDEKKVNQINKKKSPFEDKLITNFLKNKKLNLRAVTQYETHLKNANYVIIATPTDYDEKNNKFNTKSVEEVIRKIRKVRNNVNIIIKSTVPIGFTEKMNKKYDNKIFFSPEFLREGYALYDNLYPSRIIVGSKIKSAVKFAYLLEKSSRKKINTIPILFMNSSEAEAVKLFANTYLAMRISFFNELDSFCDLKKLNTNEVIKGIGYDKRIGNHYNNPSFGYGGYCLPKDTKQLLANFKKVPNTLIKATVRSNETRKKFIVNSLLKLRPKVIGIYRIVMKSGSDNYRSSAMQDIIRLLKRHKIKIIIYEPILNVKLFRNNEVCNNFKNFVNLSDIILANRMNKQLKNINKKVYSRDLFGTN